MWSTNPVRPLPATPTCGHLISVDEYGTSATDPGLCDACIARLIEIARWVQEQLNKEEVQDPAIRRKLEGIPWIQNDEPEGT